MEFFTYRMPPFLVVMGVFYIVVAAPILINMLRVGYWSGVFRQLGINIRCYWWLILSTLAVVLGFITWVDLPFTVSLKKLDQATHMYQFWDFICSLGEGGLIAGLIFTIVMLAQYFKLAKLVEVAKISLMSSLFAGLMNAVLKFIFNRQRPSIGLDQWHFFAFFRGNGQAEDLLYAFNSMPSGHTISIVAAIVPFFIAYQNKSIRCLLILFAMLIAFARVYTINHWLSDVAVASLFGFLIGLSVYQANLRRIHEI